MTTQIQRDLYKHTHHKLIRLVEDTIDLYAVANIEASEIVSDITFALAHVLCTLMIVNGLGEEVVVTMIRHLMKRRLEQARKV